MGGMLREREDFKLSCLSGGKHLSDFCSSSKASIIMIGLQSYSICKLCSFSDLLELWLKWKKQNKHTHTHTRTHLNHTPRICFNELQTFETAQVAVKCRIEQNAELSTHHKLWLIMQSYSMFVTQDHPSAINKYYSWPKHRLRLEHHSSQWLNTITE